MVIRILKQGTGMVCDGITLSNKEKLRTESGGTQYDSTEHLFPFYRFDFLSNDFFKLCFQN